MMKISTMMKTLVIAACLLPTAAFAGDGTKENPYTISELNAQKDALAATGSTVWVKADLKGLGADGTAQVNDPDNRKECAALFSDETGSIAGYSYAILAALAMDDLTNTKDLLINGIFRTGSDSGDEPEELHFSLNEIHNAISIKIKNGFRGYHVQTNYKVPKGVIVVTVRSTFTAAKNGNPATAKLGYTYYDPNEKDVITGKNSAQILIAKDGTYPLILTNASSTITGSTSLAGGTQAGLNTVKTNNRYLYRFICTADRVGFERNSDNQKEVTLDSKDEVWLNVNSLATNFYGYYAFDDGETKKWMKWTGKTISDFEESAGIEDITIRQWADGQFYDLQGRRISGQPQKGLYINNGKKYIAK